MPEDTWLEHLDSATRPDGVDTAQAAAHRVPGLTIGWHPDVRRVGERVALPELTSGREVEVSRLTPLFSPPGIADRRPLADPHLSRRPFRLSSASGREVRLDFSDANSAVLADGVPLVDGHTFSAEDLERGVVLLLAARVVLVLHAMPPSPPRDLPRFGMIGESPAFLRALQAVRDAADLRVPVLLRGESGTGKELAAEALHKAGPRRSGPFVAVNMAAIPAALSAAELFGATKGAYTGADRERVGYFQRAHGGTLFLDEVGEMPPEVQVALLRALESGEIQPVGADRPRRVDVRLVAATDADLEAAVASGAFRAPLLHRLSGFQIRIPALRERRDDVGRLLRHFLAEDLAEIGERHRLEEPSSSAPWFPAALAARLILHAWPGNVRQLRNVIRQLVVANRGAPRLQLDASLERLLTTDPAETAPPAGHRPPHEVTLDELRAALRASRWRFQHAAAQLGVSRTSFYALIERFPGVRKPRDLTREEIEACQQQCGGDIEAMVDTLEVSRKGLRRRMTELGMP